MHNLAWFGLWFFGLGALAYHKVPLLNALVSIVIGLGVSLYLSGISLMTFTLGLLLSLIVGYILLKEQLRCKYVISPILNKIKNNTPKISETEQEALDAGSVWWDGELFSGNPDWKKLLSLPAPQLTPEEEIFLRGPVEKLCGMIDNWKINYQAHDIPIEIWDFLKQECFFGLMIPKNYGGLGFSALAHSDILAKIAGKSITVASTVSVPNSLGPAELLLKYGTAEQKQNYLPNLACGKEIPCFALTAPEAGSDATAIIDTGVICTKDFHGKTTLGILLNWNKRYITLAPIATVMGLAFKLHDPEKLLGKEVDLGITCALIPTNTPGITIGKRHWPLTTMFQNGPTQGKNVFIPITWIIGGPEMAGKGWKMLIESLSCGRAISLPSVTAGKARSNAAATGAYAKIRRQFNQPIGHFEGIEEPLARIAGNVYICNAARRITAASIDSGEQPTVPGAIVKYHVTERTRQLSIDAMDIHGGKGIMQGPKNYIAEAYINAPVAITVEGANILTRGLIIFGQGAIRCHPYIMKELLILKQQDQSQTLLNFDKVIIQHISYTLSNCARAFFGYISHGRLGSSPVKHKSAHYYQLVSWASSSFAVLADASLIIIGAKLKYKEKLSGRLGDLLSMLYLASITLKHFEDEGHQEQDLELLEWAIKDLMHSFWRTTDEILQNFPNRAAALALRLIVMPLGIPINKPSDKLGHKIAQILLQPNPTRDRLIAGAYLNANELNPVGLLEVALQNVIAAEIIEKRISKTIMEESQVVQALSSNLVSETEAAVLRKALAARAQIIAVDFFDVKTMLPSS